MRCRSVAALRPCAASACLGVISVPPRAKLTRSARLASRVALRIEINNPVPTQRDGVFPLDPAEGSKRVHDLPSFWAHLNRGVRCGEVSGNAQGSEVERPIYRARLVLGQSF